MRYFVHITEADSAYLDALPLSSEARQRLRRLLIETIASTPDEIRLDPASRDPNGGPYFWRDMLILDQWGDQRSHILQAVISDAAAAFGVLQVVYLELDP